MKKRLTSVIICLLCAFATLSCGKSKTPSDTPEYPAQNTDQTDKQQEDQAKKEETKIEEIEDASLAALREIVSENKAVLGIGYMGYTTGDLAAIKSYLGNIADYPFINDIGSDSFFETDSNELYLVIPADKEATVKIYKAVLDENTYKLKKGELLGEVSDGKPFILSCNISEIMPNVILSTDTFDYSPCLSGMDGTLVIAEGIYDFSPYNKIKEHLSIHDTEE